MTRPEIILQQKPIPPTEEEMRRDNIFFRIEVGTPWDHNGHIAAHGQVARADFVLGGVGALVDAIAGVVAEIEGHIRGQLIPEAIKREEAARISTAQDPADRI